VESAAAPAFKTLDLRLRQQSPGDVSCGVQALGMALNGLDGAGPTSNSLLAYLEAQGYLYEFGTGVEELAAAALHFGYSGAYSFHGWSLDQLTEELSAGRPVVVALRANGPDQPGHFVTLTGISPDDAWVAFNDPLLGERVMPSAEFLALWSSQDSSGVAVATSAPAPASPGYETWMTAVLAMMATLSLAPSMLRSTERKGIGGVIVEGSGGGGVLTYVGMEPPSPAPTGMKWVRGKAVYETQTHTELVYHMVEKKELQQVQVGTKIEKIPCTKRILVDNGHWETTYKSETYITGYRNKKILAYYKSEKYVRYYRTQRYWSPYGYYDKKIPVYGYRRVPVYETLRVPVYGTRQVPDGKRWVEKWEYEEFTAYKTIEKPIYEERWVSVGVERIPEEVLVKKQVFKGYEWTLEKEQEPLTFEDDEEFLWQLKNSTSEANLSQMMMSTAYVLTLRDEPNASSAALEYIPYGTYVQWTGNSETNGEVTWYEVRYMYNGEPMVGWVSSTYLHEYIPGTASAVSESQMDQIFASSGVQLQGDWNLRDKRAAALAVEAVADAFSRELGHAFANIWWGSEEGPYTELATPENKELLSNKGFFKGPEGAANMWWQHWEQIPTPNEVFADMFLGWVFNTWADNSEGYAKAAYMNENMSTWLGESANE